MKERRRGRDDEGVELIKEKGSRRIRDGRKI